MANTDFSQMFYHVFKDYEIPFDEKGTTCGTVRLVQWCKNGEEPDKEKAKLEIRKVYTSGAEEKTGKLSQAHPASGRTGHAGGVRASEAARRRMWHDRKQIHPEMYTRPPAEAPPYRAGD